MSLFGTSASRIELLNKAGARFFGQVDGVLWEDVLLHLCRLTDPRLVGKHEQLTVQRLPDFVADSVLRKRLTLVVRAAVRTTAFARDWRNRHIGHRSRKRALDPNARPLTRASRKDVTEALRALAAVFELIHEEYLGGGASVDIRGGPGDAEDLLVVLDEGVHAIEAREERFNTGNLLPEDMAPRRAV